MPLIKTLDLPNGMGQRFFRLRRRRLPGWFPDIPWHLRAETRPELGEL